MEINYRDDILPGTKEVIALYDAAGLPRPTTDEERMHAMLANSNLVITAWEGERLVGVCRCITDFVWSCYLADLAVSPDVKRSGIGKGLVNFTRARLGDQCMILLLSVPTAMEYYPRIGFIKEDRAFTILRKK